MTAVDQRAPENVHGIAIGGVVGFMLLVTPPGFATALNPARAFCPMVIDATAYFWTIVVWIVFPIAGALCAGALCELFFLKGLDADSGDAVELAVVSGNAGGEMEVCAGGDLTTPMKETGTLEIELDAGLGVDAEMEIDAEVEIDTVVIVVDDLEPDFEIDVEIDAGVDLLAWETVDDTQKAAWKGFFMQNGEQFDMDLEDMQIGLAGVISGAGSDAMGDFNIEGQLNEDGSFNFDKKYAEYTVSYKGNMDGTKLAGQWSLPDQPEDAFEINLVSNNWNGFFVQNGEKNGMALSMGVSSGSIFGTGTDDVGAFLLRGRSDGGDFNFVKKYLGQHQVLYFGKVEGGEGSRTVRGKWAIPDVCEDKFALQES